MLKPMVSGSVKVKESLSRDKKIQIAGIIIKVLKNFDFCYSCLDFFRFYNQ